MRAPVLAGLVVLLSAAPALRAQEPETRLSRPEARRMAAIRLGLQYLANNQGKDGSFGDYERGVVGITSLSLLAFMAAGHQESRGPYGETLRRGLDFLLKNSLPPSKKDPSLSFGGKPSGYIYVPGDSDSRMHGHGYATQALVLAFGSGPTRSARGREMRRKILRAVRVIEGSQTVTGGWGYEPTAASFHEGSVTVTVVQALRLARDAGFVVDNNVVKRGLKYLHDSQNANGAFRYRLTSENTSAALTAAALTAMHGFAEYYSDSVRRGLEFLLDRYQHPERVGWTLYANYYAAQVFHRAGGLHWRHWQRRVVPFILSLQEASGAWDDEIVRTSRASHGRAFATAFSVLALSVQDGYLPMFQR